MSGKLLDKAIIFAAKAHAGQLRKYTGIPYITHPLEVMTIVATIKHNSDMLAAAVLHDVVEDTPVTMLAIYKTFGYRVHDLVWALTDQNNLGNRATRKTAECLRWARQSPEAQTIKLADLISNTTSIVEHDPGFAAVYLQEKQDLLQVLHLGSPELRERAVLQVEEGLNSL